MPGVTASPYTASEQLENVNLASIYNDLFKEDESYLVYDIEKYELTADSGPSDFTMALTDYMKGAQPLSENSLAGITESQLADVDPLEEENQKLRDRVYVLGNGCMTLFEMVKEGRQNIKTFKSQLDNAAVANGVLTDTAASLMTTCEQLRGLVREPEDQNDFARPTIDSLTNDNEKLKAEHAAAMERLKAEHNTAMEKLKAEHNTAIAKLQTEHNNATKKLHSDYRNFKEIREVNNKAVLENTEDEHASDIAAMQLIVADHQKKYEGASRELAKARRQIEDSKRNCVSREKYKKAKSMVKELRQELNQIRWEIDDEKYYLVKENVTLTKRTNTLDAHNNSLMERTFSLSDQISDLTNQKNSLTEENDSLTEENNELIQERNELLQHLDTVIGVSNQVSKRLMWQWGEEEVGPVEEGMGYKYTNS